MTNGSYLVREAMTNAHYKLIAHNGVNTLYDVTKGKRIRPISEDKIGSLYTIEKVFKSERALWDLQYWVNGELKETICRGVDFAVMHYQRQCKKITHSAGIMIPVKHVG